MKTAAELESLPLFFLRIDSQGGQRVLVARHYAETDLNLVKHGKSPGPPCQLDKDEMFMLNLTNIRNNIF